MTAIRLCRNVICAFTACTLVVGCATVPGGRSVSSTGTPENNPCNPVVAGIGGALIGALLGSVVGGGNRSRNAATGAVILGGAALATCMAYNYRTRQTATAEQVDRAAAIQNGGTLPPGPTVRSYNIQANTTNLKRGGTPLSLTSEIVVADGRFQKVQSVEEVLYARVPNASEFVRVKAKAPQSINAAGGYQDSFDFPSMRPGVPEGRYDYRTDLLVNGQVMASRSISTSVALLPSGHMTVAMK